MKRQIFSSVQQFINLAKSHPQVYEIPALVPIKSVADQLNNDGKGCGCQKGKILNSGRTTFEAGMSALGDSDKARLKTLFNVDEVCYYQYKNGTMQMVCI